MNTTMADGAEQRLDAQIAEALFGQPGMSKMDVANRVRELRGDGPALLVPQKAGQDAMVPHARALELVGDAYNAGTHGIGYSQQAMELHDSIILAQPSPSEQAAHCPVKHCGMTYARVPADGRCHACGATVHPSPGGQADARAQFEAWAESAGWYAVAYRPDRDAPYALNAVEFAWQAFQAALAASQQVGEPVAYIEHFADKVSRMEMTMTGLHLGIGRHPVYAAPPTQSVGEPVALGETDPIPCAWSDDDASSLVTLRDALRRIIAGTTTKDAAHFLKQPGQRRMTIKDAQEVATAHLPYVESLVHRSQGYAAPPAQAVDLGAVCQLAEKWMRIGGEDARFCAGELLALIDGKAVGNG